jgi:hypothetical protein
LFPKPETNMRYALFLTAACFALSACGPKEETRVAATEPAPAETAAPAPSGSTANAALTAEGWGPLKIGMTLDEVTQALGPDANPNAVGGPDPESCNEFRPQRAPEGLLVMIEQGKLTRISAVRASTLKTDKGFGIGDKASAIKAAYGAEAKATPHKYQAAPAEYITVWSGDKRTEPYVQDAAARGINYSVGESGKVEAIHVGGPSIQYVEGCA